MAGEETRLTPAEMRQSVDTVKKFYVPSNPSNPTDKSINDWSAADLKKVGPNDLFLLYAQITDEQYSITDALLPKGMSREDFNRNILREMRRRNLLQKEYLDDYLSPTMRTQEVKLIRASFGSGNGVPAEVQTSAGVMAIRDAGISVIFNDEDKGPDGKPITGQYRLKPDLAAAIGLPSNKRPKVKFRTDVDAYDFGYLVGSLPQFVANAQNNNPLAIMPSSPVPDDQLQARYCPVIRKIFQEGNAFPNRDAFVSGLLQARSDMTANFEPVNDHIGLTAACS